MKTNTSDSGVKAIIFEVSQNVYSKTDAKKVANKELCRKTGFKKEELVYLLLSEVEKRRAKNQRIFERKLRHNERKKRGLKTLKELDIFLAEEEKLKGYIKENFPYREASSRWAGGDTSISVKLSKTKDIIQGSGSSHRVWSDNRKWQGLDAYYKFDFPYGYNVMVLGGLLTVFDSKYNNQTVKPAIWFEQSRGFELKKINGWLVGGYHSSAKTKENAIKGAKAHKRYWLQNDEQILSVGFVEKRFGFCRPGIQNFLNKNGIEKDKMSLAELRRIVVENRELNCKLYANHLAKMGIFLNCK